MTRQRASSGGLSVENIKRLMHQRKAARVLPVPVGARIRVESPREIAGQPRICGRVGPVKTAENKSRAVGGKRARAFAGEGSGMGVGACGCPGSGAADWAASGGLGGAFFETRFGTF